MNHSVVIGVLEGFRLTLTLRDKRERKENKVFLSLLKSVPGLEERIMTTESEDEIYNIAALVSFFFLPLLARAQKLVVSPTVSYKRVHLAHAPTIQKALNQL